MQWLPPSHHQLLPPANRGDHASYPILLWFLPWPRPGWLYCYRLLVPPTQFMCCILNAAPPTRFSACSLIWRQCLYKADKVRAGEMALWL